MKTETEYMNGLEQKYLVRATVCQNYVVVTGPKSFVAPAVIEVKEVSIPTFRDANILTLAHR